MTAEKKTTIFDIGQPDEVEFDANGRPISYTYNGVQYYNHPIGTEDRPYPTINSNGELEVINSNTNPLWVFSERSYAEVLGSMMRDMPTPSMLDIYKQGHDLRTRRFDMKGNRRTDWENKCRFTYIIGEHGSGKSYAEHIHGKLRNSAGTMVVNCGGKDMTEIFSRTVIDQEAGKPVYDAIDEKLANGTLQPKTVDLLRNLLGDAFIENEGEQPVIDWAAPTPKSVSTKDMDIIRARVLKEHGFKDMVEVTQLDELDPKVTAFNSQMDRESKALQRTDSEFVATLTQIAKLEGVLNQGGSIGLKQIPGEVVECFQNDRPMLWDEYNKMQPGTDGELQLWWQFLKGETDEYVANIGGGNTFTFRRSEMGPNFFVGATGNRVSDGYSTRELSVSANDRLDPKYVYAPTALDFQHRMCQKLTGLPISTIHKMNEVFWDNQPTEAFTKELLKFRTCGLTPEQEMNIPASHFAMIKNWPRVLKATENLSKLIFDFAQAIDPESDFHKTGLDAVENPDLSEEERAQLEMYRALLGGEADKKHRDEVSIGMRLVMEMLDKAFIINSESSPVDPASEYTTQQDYSQAPNIFMVEPEDIEAHLGTRLVKIVENKLLQKCDRKPHTTQWLKMLMGKYGLVPMDLKEGKVLNDNLIENLLNISQEVALEDVPNLEEFQEIIGQYLNDTFVREGHIPEDVNRNPKLLVDRNKLNHVLHQQAQRDDVERSSLRSSQIYVPNADFADDAENPVVGVVGLKNPLPPQSSLSADQEALYQTISEEEKGLANLSAIPTSELADAKALLVSFAVKELRHNNIRSLWGEYDIGVGEIGEKEFPEKMATNTSPTGLAVQLVKAKAIGDDGNEYNEFLYVMHNRIANGGEGQTLITGTMEINTRLASALEKNGITYVNRRAPNASQKVADAMNGLMENVSETVNPPGSRETATEYMLLNSIQGNVLYCDENAEVPHQQQLDAGYAVIQPGEQPVTAQEMNAQARENLVAIFADDKHYLSKYDSNPYVLTNSPDLSNLKNTLRLLGEDDKGSDKSMMVA